MKRTAKDNASEFKALTKQGKNVRLAALVACSVYQTDNPGGRPSESHRLAMEAAGKSAIADFSEWAGTTWHRITRHLDAWEKLADLGGVSHAADLTPDMVDSIEVNEESKYFFDLPIEEGGVFDATKAGGRPRESVKKIAARAAEDPEYAEELAKATAEVAPDAIVKVVSESPAVAKAVAENPSSRLAVDREINQYIEDSRGARQPKARDEEQGPTLGTLFGLMAVDDELAKIVKMFSAVNVPEGHEMLFTDVTKTAVNGYADDIIAKAQILKQIVNGDIRTYATEADYSALLGEH